MGSLRASYDCIMSFIEPVVEEQQKAIEDVLRKEAKNAGLAILEAHVSDKFLEFEMRGKHRPEVIDFFIALAAVLRETDGEIRCEIDVDQIDPRFEFYSIEDGKLYCSIGHIAREPKQQVKKTEEN